MSRYGLGAALVLGCCLSACAVIPSTVYTEYRGADMSAGSGGTVRNVNGIEFWESGTPNRNFRILGVIHDDRNDKALITMGRDGTLAAIAKEHGGDAIMKMDATKRLAGINTASGRMDYRAETTVAVIKYLP